MSVLYASAVEENSDFVAVGENSWKNACYRLLRCKICSVYRALTSECYDLVVCLFVGGVSLRRSQKLVWVRRISINADLNEEDVCACSSEGESHGLPDSSCTARNKS